MQWFNYDKTWGSTECSGVDWTWGYASREWGIGANWGQAGF